MSLWERAQALIARTLPETHGPASPAMYARYSLGVALWSLPVTCWIGRTVFRQDVDRDAGAVSLVFGDLDIIVPVSQLPVEPLQGDRLTLSLTGGAIITGEVMAPAGLAGDEPPWRYADPQRSLYRLHLKRVA